MANSKGTFLENLDSFFQNLSGNIGLGAALADHQPPQSASIPYIAAPRGAAARPGAVANGEEEAGGSGANAFDVF